MACCLYVLFRYDRSAFFMDFLTRLWMRSIYYDLATLFQYGIGGYSLWLNLKRRPRVPLVKFAWRNSVSPGLRDEQVFVAPEKYVTSWQQNWNSITKPQAKFQGPAQRHQDDFVPAKLRPLRCRPQPKRGLQGYRPLEVISKSEARRLLTSFIIKVPLQCDPLACNFWLASDWAVSINYWEKLPWNNAQSFCWWQRYFRSLRWLIGPQINAILICQHRFLGSLWFCSCAREPNV